MLPSQRHHLTLLLLLSCCCSFLLAPIECRSRDKDNRRRGSNGNGSGGNSERMSASSAALAPSSSSSYASSSSIGAANYYANGGGTSSAMRSSSSSKSSSSLVGETVDSTELCTRHRNMKLMCYCPTEPPHSVVVLKAECWIISDGLLQNDIAWTRFYQQRQLRDLKFLVQNHGHLDYIPIMIIEALRNLTSINIEYGHIDVVPSNAFANLTQLERIMLTNNNIVTLSLHAFANHNRLRELNLEHNQIADIDRQAFHELPQLEHLRLNDNNITSLHEGLFANLPRLTHLNLANNQISVLTSDVFRGLSNLKVLKLTHNNLNFIGDTVFAELWMLDELELDDNRIERISERALDGLNTLKTLNLRHNLLKKLDNGLLRGTPALMFVNVQSNQLETLTFYTFQPIMDTLVNSTSELDLTDNNFICDCRLLWIFELRNRTVYQPLRDTLDNIVCTLQEPKLSHFVEPVPQHIRDLLKVGGYLKNNNNMENGNSIGGGTGGIATASNSRIRNGKTRKAKMRPQTLPDGAQMELVEFAKSLNEHDVNVLENDHANAHQMRRRRRSLSNGALNGGSGQNYNPADGLLHHLDDETAYKYFDDTHGKMIAQQMSDEVFNDFDRRQQQNDLYHQPTGDIGDAIDQHADNSALPESGLGIKVRLFLLRPKELPCHDEIADPTELPLSRDLVDLRSNLLNGSQSPGHAAWGYAMPFMLIIACVTFSQHFVLCLD